MLINVDYTYTVNLVAGSGPHVEADLQNQDGLTRCPDPPDDDTEPTGGDYAHVNTFGKTVRVVLPQSPVNPNTATIVAARLASYAGSPPFRP